MENIYKHPSYGMLRFSRTSGSATNLFGSSIQHSDTIRLRICEASVTRMLNSDYFNNEGELIEVEMSYSQFAEAITSMNMGNGVPVTIRWIRDKGDIKKCPFEDKRRQFENEFKANLDDANADTEALLSEISDLFKNKKSLTKADKDAVLGKLEAIRRNINDNNDFLYRQFNEQMDKTTLEAKGEIEAFAQNKLNSIAQSALVEQREQLTQLECPVEIQVTDNNDEA